MSVTVESLTPAYAAPEVFRLERPTQAGDIYSLAATLYALLSGRPPRWPEHGSLSPVQLVALHNQPLPRLPQIPEQLYVVLAKAMATNPAERYSSAAAFREALTAVSLDPSAPAPPSPPPAIAQASAPPQPQSGPPALWQHSQTYPPHTFSERMASAPPAPLAPTSSTERSKRPLVLFMVLLLLLAVVVGVGTFATMQRSDTAAQESNPSNGAECPIETKLAACVKQPECFTEAGRDNTDFGAAAPIDCGKPHNWETFVTARLPGSVQYPTYEQLRNNPYVVAMCSKQTLGRLVDSTSSWRISLLPPTKSDVDAAATPEKREALRFRCVAGKTNGTDSSAFARS